MFAVTEEFRTLARELSELYAKRKELAQEIIYKEDRLRHLGICIEFADNLEESLDGELEVEENENPGCRNSMEDILGELDEEDYC